MKIYRKILPLLRHWLKLLWCSSRFSNFPALAFQLRSLLFLITLAPRPCPINYLRQIYPWPCFWKNYVYSFPHPTWKLKSTTFQARTILMPIPSVDGPTQVTHRAIFFSKTVSNFSFRPCGNLTGCRDSFPHQHGFLGNFQGRSC